MAGLHLHRGGKGEPVLVLLHGLGAHSGVWEGMLATADRHWPGRWLAPDLRGHGGSPWADAYGLHDYAGDVADCLIEQGAKDGAVILGHSMGGAVGLALASGKHGVIPARILAFGVKVAWTPDERDWLARLAQSPVKTFETREEAAARFLRAAGLAGLRSAESCVALGGTAPEGEGWRLAADPATAMVGPPPMDELTAEAGCPFRLAAGDQDPMSRLEDLRRWDPDAVAFPGLGHSAMVEDPDAIWAWVRSEVGLPRN